MPVVKESHTDWQLIGAAVKLSGFAAAGNAHDNDGHG
jgi:hypothetical protein